MKKILFVIIICLFIIYLFISSVRAANNFEIKTFWDSGLVYSDNTPSLVIVATASNKIANFDAFIKYADSSEFSSAKSDGQSLDVSVDTVDDVKTDSLETSIYIPIKNIKTNEDFQFYVSLTDALGNLAKSETKIINLSTSGSKKTISDATETFSNLGIAGPGVPWGGITSNTPDNTGIQSKTYSAQTTNGNFSLIKFAVDSVFKEPANDGSYGAYVILQANKPISNFWIYVNNGEPSSDAGTGFKEALSFTPPLYLFEARDAYSTSDATTIVVYLHHLYAKQGGVNLVAVLADSPEGNNAPNQVSSEEIKIMFDSNTIVTKDDISKVFKKDGLTGNPGFNLGSSGLNQKLVEGLTSENTNAPSSSSNTNNSKSNNSLLNASGNKELNSISKFISNTYFWIVDLIIVLFILMLEILYIFRSRKIWGIVFDSKTRQPVRGVIVRVFSEDTNKLLETKATDEDGRFSFLSKSGSYYLSASKENYVFPSRIIDDKEDEFYSNIYHGEIIKTFRGNAILAPNIPIDPMGETLASAQEEWKKISNFRKRSSYFLIYKLRTIMLLVLTLINAGVLILQFASPLMTAGILLVLVWIGEIYNFFGKGYR